MLRNIVLGLLAVGLVVGIVFGVMIGTAVYRNLNTAPESVGNSNPVVIDNPSVVLVQTGPSCEDRANKIDAPLGSSVCKEHSSGSPALRVQSGSQVAFGTITFDAETRVWILERFIVPSYANYSYDYSGRESNVLDAPFVVGAELNPVNGEKFTICWDTTSDGCVPPTEIQFFQ